MAATNADLLARCSNCRSILDWQTRQGGSWERAPYGDEFADELHLCSECGSWSLVTLVDRFASADEIKIRGPLSKSEVAGQRERMRN
jgi:hypothetical protein